MTETRDLEALTTRVRRTFGDECRAVRALLKQHRLPDDYATGKRWVRLLGEPVYAKGEITWPKGRASEHAARWLSAGFRDPEDIARRIKAGESPQPLDSPAPASPC